MYLNVLSLASCRQVSRIARLTNHAFQTLSTATQKEDSRPRNKEGFITVFKFPLMKYPVAFTKLKFLQTGIVTSLAGWVAVNGWLGLPYEQQHVLAVFQVATFALVTLAAFGEYLRRIVGFLYFRPEDKKVRISHLSFWGRRIDLDVDLDNIVPFSENTQDPRKFGWKIEFYDKSRSLLMFTRFGGVKDVAAMRTIFGGDHPSSNEEEHQKDSG